LLACFWGGHVHVGASSARVRAEDAAMVREVDGVRWLRCLRCDAWVHAHAPASATEEHPPERAAVTPPLRGRALRDRLVLRLIAIDRAFHFVVLVGLGLTIFALIGHQRQLRGSFYRIISDLQGGLRGPSSIHHSSHGLVHELDRLLSLQSGELKRIAAIMLAYGLLEGVEAVGLWFGKRWAEYLTFIATTALVPLEVLEIGTRASLLKVVALVVNLAVVGYLIYAKRLFGLRGGEAAIIADRERTSGWAAIDAAAPPAARPAPAAPG
jgi:uncharacterized membrane protein (DUF2068 family)